MKRNYSQIHVCAFESENKTVMILLHIGNNMTLLCFAGDDCDTLSFDNIRTLQPRDNFENISQEQRNESSSDNSPAVMKPVDAAYDCYSRHESFNIDNPVYGLRTKTHSPTGRPIFTVTCSCCPHLYFGSPIM